mgnify:CR=1 FL=1
MRTTEGLRREESLEAEAWSSGDLGSDAILLLLGEEGLELGLSSVPAYERPSARPVDGKQGRTSIGQRLSDIDETVLLSGVRGEAYAKKSPRE